MLVLIFFEVRSWGTYASCRNVRPSVYCEELLARRKGK